VADISAGIMLFRRKGAVVEVLIAHPGGPFFARKHEGAWSIPKGLVDADEHLEATARREWEEETGLELPDGPWFSLGETRLKSGKEIHAWAVEGDVDVEALDGNTFELEWPPRTCRVATFPEVDRIDWVVPSVACELLNQAQTVFVDRLLKILGQGADI
jgi:predicted NUDIX family NTP pyrophosphohydrolase